MYSVCVCVCLHARGLEELSNLGMLSPDVNGLSEYLLIKVLSEKLPGRGASLRFVSFCFVSFRSCSMVQHPQTTPKQIAPQFCFGGIFSFGKKMCSDEKTCSDTPHVFGRRQKFLSKYSESPLGGGSLCFVIFVRPVTSFICCDGWYPRELRRSTGVEIPTPRAGALHQWFTSLSIAVLTCRRAPWPSCRVVCPS